MQAAQEARKQILVVEDEGLIADDIQRRLERLGYAVPAIASSGEEALRFARCTAFDLVLMDIRLQGKMDGIATAQALKDEFETPVVYLTAHADADTVSRATVTEPLGYILKPIGDLNLRSAVQIALYKHEMERRVRASESWLSTTLRSVGEGIVATNTSGEIVFVNEMAERLTGWTNAEAIGRPLREVLQLQEESASRTAGNAVLDLFPEEHRSYLLISKTGTGTPVEVGYSENRSERDRLGSILVVRDIRARREMEGRLIQSQRLEAIANLAGGLAHDFNNLLMVILGYAEELETGSKDDRDRERATEIKRAATLAGSLSKQLLTLSRRDVSIPEVLDIDAVIGEIQPLIARSLGTGRKLDLELGASPELVRRPQPVEAGIPQPGAERARRDAAGRGNADLYFAGRYRSVEPEMARPPAGTVRANSGRGFGAGNGRADAGPHLRAILHHQALRHRNRPRPGDRACHHRAERGLHRRLERNRERDQLRDSPAARGAAASVGRAAGNRYRGRIGADGIAG